MAVSLRLAPQERITEQSRDLEALDVHDEADQDIGHRLKQDLDIAWREYNRAKMNFEDMTREVRSAFPRPDSVFRLQQAAKESDQAVAKYSRALERFAQFTLYRLYPKGMNLT